MSTRIQITVPDRTVAVWRAKAEAEAIPLSTWIVLQASRPDMPAALDRMTRSAESIDATTAVLLDAVKRLTARMTKMDEEATDV